MMCRARTVHGGRAGMLALLQILVSRGCMASDAVETNLNAFFAAGPQRPAASFGAAAGGGAGGRAAGRLQLGVGVAP